MKPVLPSDEKSGPAAGRPGGLLAAYFASGWAFFIPYLVAYLLYAWLRWPVNPVEALPAGGTSRASGIPSLLHVYWFLHAIHVPLAAMATARGWRALGASGTRADMLWSLVPWFGLALLFWIPGVYMEFPSDPWQHYARVNEWAWQEVVTTHSYWKKSTYFLAYSLIGRVTPPLLQLKAFDLYYTACCLLLCWQYYRLARAIGFGARSALAFVVLNVLLLGNNVFGFYRYYGMSSTVFAQLGAVALTRVAVELLRPKREPGHPRTGHPASPPARLLHAAPAILALLALTAASHVQGVGIAAIGIAAVVVWRLVEWRRSTVGWLALAAVVLSVATVRWYPRHPLIDSLYVPMHWLTPWYSFNLFAPASLGFQRAWVIPGLLGGAELLAGLWLLRRNRIEGWLMLMPVLLLSLPCVALPFTDVLASHTERSDGYVMAFHRMFLAMPFGLALMSLVRRWIMEAGGPEIHAGKYLSLRGFVAVLGLLALVTTLPVGASVYNRLFSALMIPPDDLALQHVIASPLMARLRGSGPLVPPAREPWLQRVARAAVLTTPEIGYAMNATGAARINSTVRVMAYSKYPTPSSYAEEVSSTLAKLSRTQYQAARFDARAWLYTPGSQLALLSGHWSSNEVALGHAAQAEIFSAANPANPNPPQIWIQWISPRDHTNLFAAGSGKNVATPPVEERGRLDTGSGNQRIQVGDTLVLQPVMRTFNSNGWLLKLVVTGPGLSSERLIQGKPVPFGTVQWLYEDHKITVTQPGRYNVELIGTTLWPEQTTTVRYYFQVQP